MEQLWNEDHEDVLNLRETDVSNCMDLRKIPNLSRAINLKSLNCFGCLSLVEIASLNHLASLESLQLCYCEKLTKIPDLLGAVNLKTLDCCGCKSLVELPGLNHLASLEKLDLSYCKSLRKIPNLSGTINFKILDCYMCESLVELPCLDHLASLEKLDIDNCYDLKKFPEVPNHFSSLNLSRTQIEQVPDSIEHLVRLERLDMKGSNVKKVSSNISKLESLHHLDLSECPITEFPEIPGNLTELDVSGSDIEGLSLSHDSLSNLRYLNISRCSSIEKLQCNIALPGLQEIPTPDVPSPILSFKSLEVLEMLNCERLELLPEFPPYLLHLDAHGCRSIEKVSFADHNLYQFVSFVDPRSQLEYSGLNEYAFVMLFSNCLSLNQDSVDKIEANAMLKIGSLAEKWARENAYYGLKELICCLPGDVISEKKIEDQSEGCALNLKIAPNGCSRSRFLAIAICLVADLTILRRILGFICNYQLTAASGEELRRECRADFKISPSRRYEGAHVLILFSQDMFIKDRDYEKASFRFYLKPSVTGDYIGSDKRCIQVKKCGVHVFYVDAESDADEKMMNLTTILPPEEKTVEYSTEEVHDDSAIQNKC